MRTFPQKPQAPSSVTSDGTRQPAKPDNRGATHTLATSRSAPVVSAIRLGLLLVSALVFLLDASPAMAAFTVKTAVITIDESGNGVYINNNNIDPATKLPIETKLTADPKAQDPLNNNTRTLAYTLPAGISKKDGDVRVGVAEAIVSDVLRYSGNKLFVYSDNQTSKKEPNPDPADNDNIPPRVMGIKTVTKPEGPDDLNNGVRYVPDAFSGGFNGSDPGSNPNILLVYDFKSEGDGGEELKYKAFSQGHSVSYNAGQQRLTFAGDVISDTGIPGDPLVGASVNVPTFSLVGAQANGDFAFQASGNDVLSLAVSSTLLFQAELPSLVYHSATNTFSGKLLNPSYDYSLGSPWILGVADRFNPNSSSFDPANELRFEYHPDGNMLGLTRAFTTNGSSSGTNGIFEVKAVPEPSSLLLAIGGFPTLLNYTWLRRWVGKNREHSRGKQKGTS